MNKSTEESFYNLVSFRINYYSKTEKELREIFKKMFGRNDESNINFFDNCSYADLLDLCMCFEYYTSFYHSMSFKDLGIAKATGSYRKYFLFTGTQPSKNIYNDEIVGVCDEAVMVFKMMGDELKPNRKVKMYYDGFVLTKSGRTNEEDYEYRLTDDMVQCMNDETNLQLDEFDLEICKSNLRILSDMQSKISAYLDIANTDFVNGRQTAELMNLIMDLKRRKNDLQLKIKKMVFEIQAEYKDRNGQDESYLDRLEDDAKRLLHFETQAKTAPKKVVPSTPQEDAAAESKRGEIEITCLGE